MDETNQKLIQAPRRSKKTLSLVLILFFLVALISLMVFNTEKKQNKVLNEEEKKIFNDLQAGSQYELSETEKQKISQDLKKDSKSSLSEGEREAIIKSLQQ